MAVFASMNAGPLQHSASVSLGMAGAESNVAIALRRLGVNTTWIGMVGNDSLGDLIVRELTAEGVRVLGSRHPAAPTSTMVKERRSPHDTRVWYYRNDNAGSALSPADISKSAIREADLLHITGISPALSQSMSESIDYAIEIAKTASVPISFDLNYRSKLWPPERARTAFLKLVPAADILFASEDEAMMITGETQNLTETTARLASLGPQEVIITLGAQGAMARVDGAFYQRDAVQTNIVDTVGAGDAFVAGYLAERLLGRTISERLDTAVTLGAIACGSASDWQGLPTRRDLATHSRTDPVAR